MKFTHNDIYTNARFAAQVERYHTWPVQRKQSDGEHTWQVMRIWYQIFGPLASYESEFVIWHDAGELVAGDSPGMLKIDAPEIKPALDRVERVAVGKMGGPDLNNTPEATRLRAKVCDLIDVLEFGEIEVLQGNRLAEPISGFAYDELAKLYGKLSRPDFEDVMAYIHKFEDWIKRRSV